jgi:hypothetical protein
MELTGPSPHNVDREPPVGNYKSSALFHLMRPQGSGISVLPSFEKIERISGIVWRTLSKPRLWWDFALVWRRRGASRVVEQFVATAEKQCPVPPDSSRAEF